jgi:hypothetical protein
MHARTLRCCSVTRKGMTGMGMKVVFLFVGVWLKNKLRGNENEN